MRIEVNGQPLHLRFLHWRLSRFTTTRGTSVALYQEGDETPIATATVKCHVHDPFSRYEGRRQALTKLLRRFGKDLRAAVWHGYWLKTNQEERGERAFEAFERRFVVRRSKPFRPPFPRVTVQSGYDLSRPAPIWRAAEVIIGRRACG